MLNIYKYLVVMFGIRIAKSKISVKHPNEMADKSSHDFCLIAGMSA